MWSGFTTLWACYLLLSYNYAAIFYLPYEKSLLYLTLFSSASLLFLLPRSLFPLIVSALAHTLVEFITLPNVMNSSILSTGTHIVIIITALICKLKSKQNIYIRKQIIKNLQFYYPLAISIVYFWAGFHKLNYDFFNSKTSCLNTFIDHGSSLFPFVRLYNTNWTPFMAALTVTLELTLPLLIFWRRTRILAMAAGVLFHFWLGLIVPTFSMIMLAGYFFLLNSHDIQRALKKIFCYRHYWTMPLFILINLKSLLLTLVVANIIVIPSTRYVLQGYNLALISILLTIFFFIILFYQKQPYRKAFHLDNLNQKGLMILLLALTLINGASPYLGLKTITSFSMYSNLHVSKWSNHFLIPYDFFKIFPYVDDTAELITVNPGLKKFHKGDQLTKIQIKEMLAQPQHLIPFSFRYKNQIIQAHTIEEAKDISIDIPYWQRKFLGFTHTNKNPPQKCAW